MNIYDKILGSLYGIAIGDALGAPHEFYRAKPKLKYTGILQDEDVYVQFQFVTSVIKASSISDDTEMTLALLNSILKNKKYVVDDVILNYLNWANLKNGFIGRNTRALMKGVKTVKGFRKRQEKFMDPNIESNGSLMRCFGLALLSKDEWQKFSDIDVSLTNDNDINRICSKIHISILRKIIYNEDFDFNLESFLKCDSKNKTNDIIFSAIKDAINGVIRDVSKQKGWVVHGTYVALITFFSNEVNSFQDGMDFIAKHFINGDTDTIMSISGSILGAFYGYEKMNKEEKTSINIKKLDKYFETTDRPKIDKKLKNDLLIFIREKLLKKDSKQIN